MDHLDDILKRCDEILAMSMARLDQANAVLREHNNLLTSANDSLTRRQREILLSNGVRVPEDRHSETRSPRGISLSETDERAPASTASKHSSKSFKFLELAPEVRIQIYEHVFRGSHMTTEYKKHFIGTMVMPSKATRINNSILRTSKGIRHEAMPILQKCISLNILMWTGKYHEKDFLYIRLGNAWKQALRRIEIWMLPKKRLDLDTFPSLKEMVVAHMVANGSEHHEPIESEDCSIHESIQNRVLEEVEGTRLPRYLAWLDFFVPGWRDRTEVKFMMKVWVIRVKNCMVEYWRVLVDVRDLEILEISSTDDVEKTPADRLMLMNLHDDGHPADLEVPIIDLPL